MTSEESAEIKRLKVENRRLRNPASPAESQPYNYVGCNPTNHTDPTGAFSSDCGWSVVGGLFGTAALVYTAGPAVASGWGAFFWVGGIVFTAYTWQSAIEDCGWFD